jgi:DNA-binding phage protein
MLYASVMKELEMRTKLLECRKWDPTAEILDKSSLAQVVMECLLNNDPEGVMEAIEIYLTASKRSKLISETNVSKTTLYYSLRNKNPTIKTLAKLMHAAA